MYWIAVSQHQDIIRDAVVHDSEDMASQKAMINAARSVYRAYSEQTPSLAEKVGVLPAILYACEDSEVDELDFDGVHLTIMGRLAWVVSVEAVNFRDITVY